MAEDFESFAEKILTARLFSPIVTFRVVWDSICRETGCFGRLVIVRLSGFSDSDLGYWMHSASACFACRWPNVVLADGSWGYYLFDRMTNCLLPFAAPTGGGRAKSKV